jgi:hypothetical protein
MEAFDNDVTLLRLFSCVSDPRFCFNPEYDVEANECEAFDSSLEGPVRPVLALPEPPNIAAVFQLPGVRLPEGLYFLILDAIPLPTLFPGGESEYFCASAVKLDREKENTRPEFDLRLNRLSSGDVDSDIEAERGEGGPLLIASASAMWDNFGACRMS